MGVVRKPTISMYWSTDPLLNTPVFGAVMTRNRFLLLLKFLHFNNNQDAPNRDDDDRDRLFKLRPLLDHLFEKFQTAYTPTESVVVDESLLLWKGRLVFKQYIPLKRARFGIKIFCLCESSGYLYRFRVYTGREDPAHNITNQLPGEVHQFSVTEKVVLHLMLPLLDQGYKLYMDNWYSSIRLYLYLRHRQTNACGTIRQNRCPVPVRNSAPAQNQVSAFSTENVVCFKYKDKRNVNIITTMHSETSVPVPPRGRPGMEPNRAQKPEAIVAYNKNMGAVDQLDQVSDSAYFFLLLSRAQYLLCICK